jgi:hypothetical protein
VRPLCMHDNSFSMSCCKDRRCGLVIRVTGYRSRGQGSILRVTDFLRSTGSGTVFTQPREYNEGAT